MTLNELKKSLNELKWAWTLLIESKWTSIGLTELEQAQMDVNDSK